MTEKIELLIRNCLNELNMSLDDVKVIVSNRKDLCDYQFDGCFALAKLYHKSPMEIGELIASYLGSDELFSKVDVCNPGFINFSLSDKGINEEINLMMSLKNYGIKESFQKIVIDYGGPNIAKPLHVGHLRSAIVGEAIKRILKYQGNTVIADVHLGDYGLQIGEVIYGIKEKNIPLNKVTLDDLNVIYPDLSGRCKEDEELKNECALITKELQDGKYRDYFEVIKDISIGDIKRIYDYLDVSFDTWYGESDSYPYIPQVTSDLEGKGLLLVSEGAKIVRINKESDSKEMPPLIYQKQNSAYLYSTTELATIKERIIDYNPDMIIYIADRRQEMHFESVFRVCEKLHYSPSLEFLGFGTVNGSDGKPYKTRAGNAPRLDDLFRETKEGFLKANQKNASISDEDLDILVNAIIKFADLQNNREKDYIFDINKFSQVNGKTGPYVLYTYLRIKSILAKESINIKVLSDNIYNDVDRNLRLKILELPNIFSEAANLRLPSILCNYIYELCVCVNAFYEVNHINNLNDEEKKQNWLHLLAFTNNIIEDMLNLLSIKIPERM